MGQLHLDRQNLTEALREEETAVRLDPGNRKSRLELARLYLGLSDFNRADEQVREALRLTPTAQDVLVLKAHLVLEQGKAAEYPEAERVLRQAIQADPENAGALADLGRLLLARGEPKEAARYLDRVLGVEPRHREAVQNLARAFSLLHREEEARALRRFGEQLAADDQRRKELERVLSQHPDDGAALYEMATLTERDGDYVRSINLLEAAARVKPDDRTIQQRLSAVRARLARATEPAINPGRP
jgi:tetratricopeptide (TPR) repeat protein